MTLPKVIIRKFQPGDEGAVSKLVAKGAMVTVNPFFFSSAVKEGVIQLILMTAAILFIVVGTSLKNSLLAIPLVLILLYVGIYVGHWVKILKTHGDLNDIHSSYLEDPRKGFWVAVLTSAGSVTSSAPPKTLQKDYTFHVVVDDDDEIDNDDEMFRNSLHPNCQSLIGTLAVDIKKDPDMREPPHSVALVKRMTVSKTHRRRGVGAALLDVGLKHCLLNRFRAVELVTTEHHQAARNLYASRGFELQSIYHKNYLLWGIVSLSMYRLRVACSTIAKKMENLTNPTATESHQQQQCNNSDITDDDIFKVD